MEISVLMVLMSHLSDLQGHEVSMSPKERNMRFDFLKYLIQKHKNTDTMIDPNVEFVNFQREYPSREYPAFKPDDLVYVVELEQPFENWTGTIESYNGNGFYNVVNAVDDVIVVHEKQLSLVEN